ncbi:MAG: PadR family transcriptional regulator [Acidobacteriota bacterium]
MKRRRKPLDDFGRLAETALLILISLLDGPNQNHAITSEIEEIAGHRTGPGTLYGALARLEKAEFVQALAGEGRRVPYALTDVGRQALERRLEALETVSRAARLRLAAS